MYYAICRCIASNHRRGTSDGGTPARRGIPSCSDATLDDLREAITTYEDTVPVARRVLGGGHPLTAAIELDLRKARAILSACETPPMGANCGDTYRVMYSHDTEGVESPRGT